MGSNSSKSENAQSIGNLKLYFNKTEFIQGETVEDLECEAITLRFKATEQMIYKGTPQKPTPVIDRIAHMIQINQKLTRGSHNFKFQYQLPNTLQPSCYIDKANETLMLSSQIGGQQQQNYNQSQQLQQFKEGETETQQQEKVKFTLMYMMVCELDIKDSNILNLSNVNVMKIGSCQNNQPINDHFSENLSNFFGQYGCYKQHVFIKRSEFHSGETIPIQLGFENIGDKPMKQIQIKLIREQHFFNPDAGANQKIKKLEIGELIVNQIVPGKSVKNNVLVNFNISSNPKLVLPSYQGGAFSCRYYLQFTFTFNGACCSQIQSTKTVPISIISKGDRRIQVQN